MMTADHTMMIIGNMNTQFRRLKEDTDGMCRNGATNIGSDFAQAL